MRGPVVCRPRRRSFGHDGGAGEVATATVKHPGGACKLLRIRGDAARASRAQGGASGFQVAGRGSPAATAAW